MSKTRWPKEVTWPEAKDFCRHSLDGPNGTHCMLGWIENDFPLQGHQERAERVLSGLIGDDITVPRYNDFTPFKVVAATYQEMLRKLGYEVVK